MVNNDLIKNAQADLESVQYFVPKKQMAVMLEELQGANGVAMASLISKLRKTIESLPPIYEGNKTAYLRYYADDWNWYIMERDLTDEQHQAFGLVDGFCRELGYINIHELRNMPLVQLDLNFEPILLAESQE